MTKKLASTLAITMLAASSFAFAAGNNDGGKDDGKNDGDKTGSIQTRDTSEPPVTEDMIEDCKTAPVDDLNCQKIQNR